MASPIGDMIIKVDLDSSGVNKSMTGINRQLKSVNSEMRANLSSFGRAEKSTEKYGVKIDGLTKRQKLQKESVEQARKEYQEMVKQHGENSAKAEGAAIKLNEQIALYEETGRELSNLSSEFEEFQRQQEIQASKWHKVGSALDGIGDKMQAIGGKMQDVGKSMSMKITAPIVALGGLAVKTGLDYEASMSRVAATSGATGKDLDNLKDKAREMGRTTQFSASESAEAMNFMAMAGWDAEEMMGGISGVMDLAAASGEDLASVSDIVTDGLSAFGLQAEDSGRFADVLASASSNANTNIGIMGESFKNVAPVAGAMGYSIEDTSVALGLMANAGIKGSKSGTALRNMMTNLAKPTDQMKGAMDELGLSLKDSDGEMKSFDDIMQDLRGSFADLDEGQKAQYASTLFGKEAMSGALAVINASEEDYNDLAGAIDNSEGAASDMADIVNDNLKGSLKETMSAIQDLGISIYEILQPALMKVSEKVREAVNWINNLSPAMKTTIVVLAGIAAAIGPVLLGLGTLIKTFGLITSTIGVAMKGIVGMGGAMTLLSNPVGWVIAAIAALTAGFVLLYKKSETFRNFIHKLGATLKQVFHTIMDAVQPMIDKIVGFFQDNIPKLIEGVKNLLSSVAKFIKPAIDGIVSFFQGIISTLKSFWDKEGKQIMKAVQNIADFIIGYFKFAFGIWESIVKSLWTVVKWAFDKILSIIDFIMPAVLFIIETVWGNIKGVISGTLDVIMGAVKVFSGMFTGDFSKMWEGVKQMFTGAIKAVWNYIQLLFIGRILKAIGSFVSLFSGLIKSMWTGIKSVFSTVIKWIVEFVKNRFTAMGNTINTITTTIRNIISKIWNGILSFFKTVIKGIVDFVKQRFTNLKNNTTNIFTGVRDMAKRVWNKTKDNIVNPIKNGVNWAIKKFNGFKDSVTETFKNIKDNVFGYVSDMIQKVKDMPGNMKDNIVKGAGKVKDGMLEIGRKMVDGIASGVNGVISAVEWVLKKFDSDKTLGRWKPADTFKWYAHGTKGAHPGGPAVVGDGKGSNAGSELMQDPKGNFSLSPAKPTLIPNMPKGTQVWSATETREALTPQYAWGINFKDVAKALKLGGEAMTYSDSKTNRVLGKAAEGIGTGIDVYTDAPKTLLNAGLKAMGVEVPNFPAAIGDMAKGGFNYAKKKAVSFIKRTQDDELESVASPVSGGASAWRSHIKKAAARMNESITNTHINGIIAQINRESGGNEKITQSPQVVDVNTLAGNPARGLLQYIPQTFAAYKMKGHNNIYSGYDQLLAFFNNKNWRKDLPYGTRGWGPTGVRKFATGGLIKKKQLAMLAEEGHPEMVIPTDPKRRSDAMKLLALTGKMLGVGEDDSGSVRPNRLPNVRQRDNSSQSDEIAYLNKSVELLTEMMGHLVNGKGFKDINQHITINSPDATSPADNARKIKQASRQLAAEWR